MAEQEQSSKLPIAGFLVIAAAIAGTLVWNRVPLDAGRPAREKSQQHRREVLQDINARLWEDPLSVVWRHEHRARSTQAGGEKSAQGPHTIPEVCSGVLSGSEGKLDLLLLGVMVSGSRYLDASENRSRARYALQAALSVAHFVPLDAQRMGLLTPDPLSKPRASRRLVPFEIYHRRSEPGTDSPPANGRQVIGGSSPARSALVLWIEEEAFSQPSRAPATPLTNVANLARALSEACGGPAHRRVTVETAIIGPADSDTLRDMVHEVDGKSRSLQLECGPTAKPREQHCEAAPYIRQVRFYSAFATASGRELLRLNGSSPYHPCGNHHWLPPHWDQAGVRATGSVLYHYFHSCGIELFSTIATDEELSKALVAELQCRQSQGLSSDGPGCAGEASAKSATPDYYIVLISEADTYYGRMLPKAFLQSLGLEYSCEEDPEELPKKVPKLGPCRVLRYNYLRGLDGQVPPAEDTTDSTKDDKQKESAAQADRAAAALERGEGPRQFDYLRRLSERIRDESRRLEERVPSTNLLRGAARDQIRAIGVLGSDVYDKIAVMRALREDFPHAVFFTTDLDARLLASEQYDWTRNVVVASGFGLELAPCVQRWVPPFRGTYQTSAYFSARLALYNAYAGDAEPTAAVLCPEYAPGDTVPLGQRARLQRAAWTPRVSQAEIDSWLAGPRLYEIGRQHAWDLSESPRASTPGLMSVQPLVASLVPDSAGLSFGIGLAVLLLLTSLLVRPVRDTFVDSAYCLRYRAEASQKDSRARGAPYAAWTIVASLVVLFAWLAQHLASAYREASTGAGEPVLWFQGISAWPSELLRCLALVLVALLLFAACGKSKRNAAGVARRFLLKEGGERRWSWKLALGWLTAPSSSRAPGEPSDKDQRQELCVQSLWNDYAEATRPRWCIRRAILWAVAFGLLAVIIMSFWGFPGAPLRGPAARSFNLLLVLLVTLGYLVVLFFVADLTRLADRFCDTVSDPDVQRRWPPGLIEEYARELSVASTPANAAASEPAGDAKGRLRDRVVDAWLVARIVAERTSAITPLIYFPFLLLALIVMSRWHMFDNWDMPIGLLVVYLASLGVAGFSAWSLQRTGARVRKRCIVQLERCLLARKGDSDEYCPSVEQIEQMIERIRKLKQGAFVPFVEQPLVRAILLPFASAGGLEVIAMLGLVP